MACGVKRTTLEIRGALQLGWHFMCLDRRVSYPNLFLVIAAVLVPAYALVIPPFQIPDEDCHLWRAYSVSEQHLVGPRRTQLPTSFLALRGRFPPRFEQVPERRIVRPEELRAWLRQPLEPHATAAVENPNANLYSFVPYAATALVLRTGRALKASPLMQMYAGRLVNGAIYVCLLFLSLRILPDFRILSFMVALTPMSLSLAASFSADSLTLGLTALFTALVFRLAFEERILLVRIRDGLPAVGVLMVLSLCKFNPWLALLALLIPAKKFRGRRGRIAFAGLCVAAACATAFLWQHANAAALSAFQSARAADGKLLAANAAFVAAHPIRFAEIVLFTTVISSWVSLQEFVGFFGWLSVPMHPLLVMLYAAGIIFAAFMQPSRLALSRSQRNVLACVVLGTFISLNVLMWVFESDKPWLHDATQGLVFVRGIQGRYFLPIALPALALVSKRRIKPGGWRVSGILAPVVVVNAGALLYDMVGLSLGAGTGASQRSARGAPS